MQNMIDAREICKSFGSNRVLCGIDFEVNRGEVVCLLGPSGSGKSTFLRCINHLEKIDSGALTVDGKPVGYDQIGSKLREMRPKDVAKSRAEIGMVFQRFNLFDNKTVISNLIEAPVKVKGEKKGVAVQRARELLDRVGLAAKETAYPAQLSGGQQQRVGIARALAMQPKLLLFDEPTSALDPELVGEVLSVIKELAREGMTMVVVTHEIGFAREMGDKIVLMDDGVVVEQGSPDEVLTNPKKDRTREFLSRVI